MEKDYKKIAYNELLEDLKNNLKSRQQEKEKLEIEYEKLNAEKVLYKRLMRGNEKYRLKHDEVSQKYRDFNFDDIDYKIEEAQALVRTLEDVMLYEFE